MNTQHRPLLIALNVAALVAFILTAVFNGLAANPNLGVFINNTGTISDAYYLEITPAGFTFSVWGLIYLWQAAWIIYGLVNVFRVGPQGPLYLNPVLLTPTFFGVYTLNLLINISWLFLWDREMIELSFTFLAMVAGTLYTCLYLSYKALEENKAVLAKQQRKLDDILIRVLVHNGLGIYAGWTTIATFLNMGFVMAYRSIYTDISQAAASITALCFVAATLVIFVATDLTIFDKYSRYTITPYAVAIWALSGSLQRNFDSSKASSIIGLILVIVTAIALIVKIVLIIIRYKTKPVLSSSIAITDTEEKA